MKKILLVLATILTMLVPLSISSPAEAGDCIAKTRSWDSSYAASSGYSGIAQKQLLAYEDCGNFIEFNYVRYQVLFADGTGCSGWPQLDGFRSNMGAFGTWNPPTHFFACPFNSGDGTKTWFGYPSGSDAIMWKSNSDYCAKFYFTIVKDNLPDSSHESDTKCLW